MLIANYRGKSWQSQLIRFATRSEWSHTAFMFDAHTELAALQLIREGKSLGKIRHFHTGAVIEAWMPAVRNVSSLSAQHTPFTAVDLFSLVPALTMEEEKRLIQWLAPTIGEPYSVWNILRFLTRHPGNLGNGWFCSELVWEGCKEVGRLLHPCTQAWEVPPNWMPRSLRLAWVRQETTGMKTKMRPPFEMVRCDPACSWLRTADRTR